MTVRAREARDRRSAIAIVTDPEVVDRPLEDPEHFPGGHSNLSTVLGTLAVTAATINIVGGFLITDRMLKMFRRETRNRD